MDFKPDITKHEKFKHIMRWAKYLKDAEIVGNYGAIKFSFIEDMSIESKMIFMFEAKADELHELTKDTVTLWWD